MQLPLWMGFVLTFSCNQTIASDVHQKADFHSNDHLNISVFQQTTADKKDTAQHGTDVTLSCKLLHPPSSSRSFTLQWEKDGAPVPNITLFLNNTAFLLLLNVDQQSEGKYTCKMRLNGTVSMQETKPLQVMEYTHSKTNVVYRGSSGSSDLSLICKSKKFYSNMTWTWEQNQPQVDLVTAETGRTPVVKGPIKSGKHSTTNFTGYKLVFHISPVKFNYSGTYRCVTPKANIYSTLILHTLKVSAEPPDGVLRNQPVVLTCKMSSLTNSVTLAWLRMEGNVAVWVQHKVLSEKEKRKLTITVNSISEKELLWQCAVFTENSLRALVPITLHLLSEHHTPEKETASDVSGNTVIIVTCAVTACVVVLLVTLLFY